MRPRALVMIEWFAELNLELLMVARGRFELPSMGLFLVRESKAHHWPGHCFRPLLVHYTTGLQETRVSGQDPISLVRSLTSSFGLVSEQ